MKVKRRASRKAVVKGPAEATQSTDGPKSFILKKGRVGKTMKMLTRDLRVVMSPNTATHLRTHQKNTLKDFLAVCGIYGVSHMMVLSSTDNSSYLRLFHCPKGPTLLFKILGYSNIYDILASKMHQYSVGKEFNSPPILIANGFTSEEKHVQLMLQSFRTFFPVINLEQIKVKDVRRALLIDYDSESGKIEWRHYIIKASEAGISKGFKRLLKRDMTKKFRDTEDIADYLLQHGANYESDFEDSSNNCDSRLDMPFVERNGTSARTICIKKVAIRLYELGPRMTLKLHRVYEHINSGNVIYGDDVETSVKIRRPKTPSKPKTVHESNVNVDDPYGNIEWFRKETNQEPTEEEKRELRSYKPKMVPRHRKRAPSDAKRTKLTIRHEKFSKKRSQTRSK